MTGARHLRRLVARLQDSVAVQLRDTPENRRTGAQQSFRRMPPALTTRINTEESDARYKLEAVGCQVYVGPGALHRENGC